MKFLIKKESAPLVQTQNQNSNGPIRANEALPVISISSNSENVKIDTGVNYSSVNYSSDMQIALEKAGLLNSINQKHK